jgi:hypothetical protein
LGDAGLRKRLRRAAHERRSSLKSWDTTARCVAAVLAAAAGEPGRLPPAPWPGES